MYPYSNNYHRRPIYKVLANLVAAFHWLLIGYLISNVWLIANGWYSHHPLFWYIYLVVVSATSVGQILFLGCPLVTLEATLRHKYDPATPRFYGSFVAHGIKRLTGIVIPPRLVTIVLAVIVVGSAVYWVLH